MKKAVLRKGRANVALIWAAAHFNRYVNKGLIIIDFRLLEYSILRIR